LQGGAPRSRRAIDLKGFSYQTLPPPGQVNPGGCGVTPTSSKRPPRNAPGGFSGGWPGRASPWQCALFLGGPPAPMGPFSPPYLGPLAPAPSWGWVDDRDRMRGPVRRGPVEGVGVPWAACLVVSMRRGVWEPCRIGGVGWPFRGERLGWAASSPSPRDLAFWVIVTGVAGFIEENMFLGDINVSALCLYD